jgi:hypothetical protein
MAIKKPQPEFTCGEDDESSSWAYREGCLLFLLTATLVAVRSVTMAGYARDEVLDRRRIVARNTLIGTQRGSIIRPRGLVDQSLDELAQGQ